VDSPPRDIGNLLRLLAEQTREHAFLFTDPKGRIIAWSSGAEKIFGYGRGEAVGLLSDILFTPEDRAEGLPEFERQVAQRDDAAEDDRWQLRKDGSRFWATGMLVALRDPAGALAGYGKVLRDRTDLKEQLETLRNLARDLQAAAERKDVFLSTLSHELRNPLAPIANALQIVRLSAPELSSQVTYALKVIERQAHLLERLVDDLLDLTRVGAGKVDLHLEPVVLQDLVTAAIDDVAGFARKRGHRVDMVLAEGQVMVEVDRDRMHQVLVNLLTNAAKYTPPGGRIWVKASREAEEAVFRVEDNGLGIPPEMLPRIFDLFTQVDTARHQSQGGLGIGLALVKNLVSLHGGSVQVRSDGPGKGSEFTVRLPLASPMPAKP
jgi:PAS domain S-box-containing protein